MNSIRADLTAQDPSPTGESLNSRDSATQPSEVRDHGIGPGSGRAGADGGLPRLAQGIRDRRRSGWAGSSRRSTSPCRCATSRSRTSSSICRRSVRNWSTGCSGGCSAVGSYFVIVGVASLLVAVARRPTFGLDEPSRGDQFAGFGLGTAKGLIVASFVVAGLKNYALPQIEQDRLGRGAAEGLLRLGMERAVSPRRAGSGRRRRCSGSSSTSRRWA